MFFALQAYSVCVTHIHRYPFVLREDTHSLWAVYP